MQAGVLLSQHCTVVNESIYVHLQQYNYTWAPGLVRLTDRDSPSPLQNVQKKLKKKPHLLSKGRQHNSEKTSIVIFPKFRTVTNPKKMTPVIIPKIDSQPVFYGGSEWVYIYT